MKRPGIDRPVSPRRWPTRGALIIVMAMAGALAAVPAASAQAAATKTKGKKVVQVVTRTPEGSTSAVTMLATVKGANLYTAPASGCTGGCLTVWPPLYVAKGKTPTGVTGLGTVSVTVGRRPSSRSPTWARPSTPSSMTRGPVPTAMAWAASCSPS